MNLAQMIIEYRTRQNISQLEMARRCRVDRTTLLKAENGGNVSRLTAGKILNVIKREAKSHE